MWLQRVSSGIVKVIKRRTSASSSAYNVVISRVTANSSTFQFAQSGFLLHQTYSAFLDSKSNMTVSGSISAKFSSAAIKLEKAFHSIRNRLCLTFNRYSILRYVCSSIPARTYVFFVVFLLSSYLYYHRSAAHQTFSPPAFQSPPSCGQLGATAPTYIYTHQRSIFYTRVQLHSHA